ncbi:MAG: hypothetical protein KKD44_25520 [Proteobacteria bacterium]|nr:hypothetical protein [Pseudomonadota bacterium]
MKNILLTVSIFFLLWGTALATPLEYNRNSYDPENGRSIVGFVPEFDNGHFVTESFSVFLLGASLLGVGMMGRKRLVYALND